MTVYFRNWRVVYVRIFPTPSVNTQNRGDKMENNTEKGMSRSMRLFLKSAMWTVVALSLIAIGYFGAEMLFG